MLSNVLLWLDELLMGLAIFGMIRHFRVLQSRSGRHVSRPLARRIGRFRAALVRDALVIGSVVAAIEHAHFPARLGLALYWLWTLDDIYFGDDDEHKRWDWVKVKLRKWKPVMKRLVQQWKPRAPKVPVPA